MNIPSTEFEYRQEIIRITRLMVDQDLIRSSEGNISARLDMRNGIPRFLVTPSNRYKLSIEPDELVLIDLDGNNLDSASTGRPSSEWKLHRETYRLRPDVNAVIHAHPPYSTALTLTGQPFPIDLIPEVVASLGTVPIAPYAMPGTDELATSVHPFIRDCDVVLLSHHGSVSVGTTLEEALLTLERVEHAARIFFIAKSIGPIIPLPPDEIIRLVESNRRLWESFKK